MKPIFFLIRNTLAVTSLSGMLAVATGLTTAHGDIAPQAQVVKTASAQAAADPKKKNEATKPKPLHQARLFLTNGDRIRGKTQTINDNQELLFTSESLQQSADFPLSNILAISLNQWKTAPKIDTTARIQIHPRFHENTGDTITGELKELTPDSIKLDTWYGGIITLKRSMVQSLKMISHAPGYYHGPNNLAEWTLSGDDNAWDFRNGALISAGTGDAGKDIGLREKSHISFNASWQKDMRFKFMLYANKLTSKSAAAYYHISLNRNYAYLQTKGSNQGKLGLGNRLAGGRWQQIAIQPKEKRAHFDVFVDRKAGTAVIYIDGTRACLLQSQKPDPANLGTGLIFNAEPGHPIEFSDISVSPWNGTTLPKATAPQKAAAGKTKTKADPNAMVQQPHKIILNNGDEVPGTVGIVDDGLMMIKTPYTAIRIPLDKIKSLSLGGSDEEPKKYRQDIRAWFHGGGFITLKLASLHEAKISGYNQAAGDVTLDIAAFRLIEFNIYNNRANQAREKIRF